MHRYRRSKELLVQRLDHEMVVYDKTTGHTHLLQSEHILVFEASGSRDLQSLAREIFPNEEDEAAQSLVEQMAQQLCDKGIVVSNPGLSRRSFSKAAAAIPFILTFVAPMPAAANSLGTWDSDIDGMTGSNMVMVPSNAMHINFTLKGGSGGGGGGGGFAIDSMGGTREGANGGAGAFGLEVSATNVAVTAGSNLTVTVGAGGNGGKGGGDGIYSMAMGGSYVGGSGGKGGSGSTNGADGVDGGGDSDLARGGGGGGGGRGSNSQIVGITGALAAGGTGGGGGEGGMGSGGMVGGTADPGSSGIAGGAAGASGATSTDGGNGGGYPTATLSSNSATGTAGAGSTGGGSGVDGGDGESGRVYIEFCP